MKKVLVLFIVAIATVLVWLVSLLMPVSRDGTLRQFRVDSGQGVNQISRNLHDQGFIKSSLMFETILWALGAEGKVQAGVYVFSSDQNLLQVITSLLQGRYANASQITFIEGWNLDEYRVNLEKYGYEGSAFTEITRDPQYLLQKASPESEVYELFDYLGPNRSLEGYLFPDTYAIDAKRDVELLVQKMLMNFNKKFSSDLRDEVARQKRTIDEVVILASIVEKEVASSKDRALVADIFLKRLKEGMALQSDATVNYLTGSGRARSTVADLAIDSPYNTYKYSGLPPGPIGNPSLDAMRAVIYPEENPFYYFLTDAQGVVHYGVTFADHQENRRKYLDN